jgi:hypothetical protein
MIEQQHAFFSLNAGRQRVEGDEQERTKEIKKERKKLGCEGRFTYWEYGTMHTRLKVSGCG